MKLEAKYLPLEEALRVYPEFFNEDVVEEQGEYFALMVWHQNIDWNDIWPDNGIVVVTDLEKNQIKYVLPA